MATIQTINSGDQITSSRADLNTNFANLNSDKIETSVIDTDTAMAANSDTKIPSQKAVKTYFSSNVTIDASTTVKGVVEEATSAEVLAGTATGSTGARLYVNPSTVSLSTQNIGDGSDGVVVISSGTTTLVRDMYYDTLTVNGTGILKTAGYRVYARSVTVDSSSGANINHNGNNGGNGANAGGAGTAGTAGAATAGNTVPSGLIGGIGGLGSTTTCNVGVNSSASTNAMGSAGGAGGISGRGSSGSPSCAGGTAGTFTVSANRLSVLPEAAILASTFPTYTVLTGANGGGGGAGASQDNGVRGAGGGGGGGGGGCVWIASNVISLTGTACIQVKGGNGGNGGNGTSGGGSNGGGGGGGGGGSIVLIAKSLTGTGTTSVTGGIAGIRGAFLNGVTDGSDGTAGTAGKVYQVNI